MAGRMGSDRAGDIMIYELWIGDRVATSTGNLAWLLGEGVAFHRRRAWGRRILITSRAAP